MLRPRAWALLDTKFAFSVRFRKARCYSNEPSQQPSQELVLGTFTPNRTHDPEVKPSPPFFFDTGYALFAKRPSRPFPPPFVSTPSGSFSDPLSTHNNCRDRRPMFNGEIIRGITNGDDAVFLDEKFIVANDGVGAWAARKKGHAALWSRLVLHFWALEADRHYLEAPDAEPDPVAYLQTAYEQTINATTTPTEWNGTTTACGALLHYQVKNSQKSPLLYVTNLGDCQCVVIRPRYGRDGEAIFKTIEQWHWFDCPRQLGTNSPDTPTANAVLDKIDIEEDDVVITMSDGVVDNLWEHEILENVVDSIDNWKQGASGSAKNSSSGESKGLMLFVAEELVKAARSVAENPYAESPFMERAVEEGLAMEGGKLDDISVAAARCRRRKNG